MTYRRECRILADPNEVVLQNKVNGYLSDGWAITHMSTAMATVKDEPGEAVEHWVTVVVERPVREPETIDEESPAAERERRGW